MGAIPATKDRTVSMEPRSTVDEALPPSASPRADLPIEPVWPLPTAPGASLIQARDSRAPEWGTFAVVLMLGLLAFGSQRYDASSAAWVASVRADIDEAAVFAEAGNYAAAAERMGQAIRTIDPNGANSSALAPLRDRQSEWERSHRRAPPSRGPQASPPPSAPRAAASPPPAQQRPNVGECANHVACAMGYCSPERRCVAGLAPSLWQLGNRWVFERDSSSAIEERHTSRYRYVREITDVEQVGATTRVTYRLIGGDTHNDSETIILEGGCMRLVQSGGRERQLWCLPPTPGLWQTESFLGTQTRVARFLSDTGYDTAISPNLGWVSFMKNTPQRRESYRVVGYSIAGVRAGDYDAQPATCDWDARDYRVGELDLARRANTPAERDLSSVLRGAANRASVLQVRTPGSTFPQRVLAVQVGNTVRLTWSSTQALSIAGTLNDLGYWRDPVSGLEHLVMLTTNGGAWSLVVIAGNRIHTAAILSSASRMSMAPIPTMDGCVLRITERNSGSSRVADLRTSATALQQVSGSLGLR